MQRHPNNPNLIRHTDPLFHGYPVQVDQGPLIRNYLEAVEGVTEKALSQYRRVFAFRCDLRLPTAMAGLIELDSNALMNRFIASLKAKIQHNREVVSRKNGYAHPSIVRYVWAREVGEVCGHVHYHVVILLNADAFRYLGVFEIGRDNLFNRIVEAWASALGVDAVRCMGRVEFPRDSRFLLSCNDQGTLETFFGRVSYLCKEATKQFGNGIHAFGCSRG